MLYQCQKLGKIFTGPTYKLLFSFTVISDVHKSFIPYKTTFTKYCLTQWISKLLGSFEIHWIRQYLGNFMSLAGNVNTTVYKTKPIFTGLGHGKLSWFITWQYTNKHAHNYLWQVIMKHFIHILGQRCQQSVEAPVVCKMGSRHGPKMYGGEDGDPRHRRRLKIRSKIECKLIIIACKFVEIQT